MVRVLGVERGEDSLPYDGPVPGGGVASGDEAAEPRGGYNQLALRQFKQDGKDTLLRQAISGGVISPYSGYDEIGGGRAAHRHEVAIVRGENTQPSQGRRKLLGRYNESLPGGGAGCGEFQAGQHGGEFDEEAEILLPGKVETGGVESRLACGVAVRQEQDGCAGCGALDCREGSLEARIVSLGQCEIQVVLRGAAKG